MLNQFLNVVVITLGVCAGLIAALIGLAILGLITKLFRKFFEDNG